MKGKGACEDLQPNMRLGGRWMGRLAGQETLNIIFHIWRQIFILFFSPLNAFFGLTFLFSCRFRIWGALQDFYHLHHSCSPLIALYLKFLKLGARERRVVLFGIQLIFTIHLLSVFICCPQISVHWPFLDHSWQEQTGKMGETLYVTFSAEAKPGNALPSCVTTRYTCVLYKVDWMSCLCHFCAFSYQFHCLKWLSSIMLKCCLLFLRTRTPWDTL
jgi:hypothetical protein